MTVEEFIRLLEKLPPDSYVQIDNIFISNINYLVGIRRFKVKHIIETLSISCNRINNFNKRILHTNGARNAIRILKDEKGTFYLLFEKK